MNDKNEITWGDLRTLNSDRLNEYFIKAGRGKSVEFKLSKSSNATFSILSTDSLNKLLESKKENERLISKINTISNIANL